MGSIVYNTYRPKMINNNLVDRTTWTQYLQQIPESEVARIYPGYEAAKNRLDTSTPNNLNILNVSGFFLSDGSPLNDELQYQIELEVSASTAHRYFNIIWYNPDTDSFVNTTATSSNGFDMLSYHQSFKTYTPPVVDDKLHYLDNLGLQRFKANIDENLNEIKRTPVTTSGTGAAYVAQVKGINAANIYMVPVGTSFTMIPHTDSTTVKPTLNVNGLGAREIRVKSMVNNDAAIPTEDKFLLRDKPVDVMFDGTYWVCDMTVVDSAAIGLEDIAKKAEDAANAANSAEDKAVKLGDNLPIMVRSGIAEIETIELQSGVTGVELHNKADVANMFGMQLYDNGGEFYVPNCMCFIANRDMNIYPGTIDVLSLFNGKSENNLSDGVAIVLNDPLNKKYIPDFVDVSYTYVYVPATPTTMTFVIYSSDDNSLNFYKRDVIGLPTVNSVFDGKTVTNVAKFNEHTKYNNAQEVPWFSMDMKSDVSVYFKDIISPIYTCYWFSRANVFKNIYFNNLNTNNTIDMSNMFRLVTSENEKSASIENLDMSMLDTSSVVDMSEMFAYQDSIKEININNWNTINVKDMSCMFRSCSGLKNIDLSMLNTSNVVDMSEMFAYCGSIRIDNISMLNTSNVVDMSEMFSNISVFNDIPYDVDMNIDAPKLSDISGMFKSSVLNNVSVNIKNAPMLTKIDSLFNDSDMNSIKFSTIDDSGKPIKQEVTAWRLFYHYSNQPASSIDLSDCYYKFIGEGSGMFENCGNIKFLNLSNVDISELSDISNMFNYCNNLTYIYVSDGFVATSYVGNNSFNNCYSLIGCKGTKYDYNHVDADYARIDNPPNEPGYFSEPHMIRMIGNKDQMFIDNMISQIDNNGFLDIETHKNQIIYDNSVLLMYGVPVYFVFNNSDKDRQEKFLGKITSVSTEELTIRLYKFVESIVILDAFAVYSDDDKSLNFYKQAIQPDAGQQFNGKTATKIYTDIETSNYEYAQHVPWGDNDIISVDVVNKISPISTQYWFDGMENLVNVNLEKLDTSNVVYMNYMFLGCTSIVSLNLSKFNTHNVRYMSGMFNNCTSLTNLDISNFDTSNVESMVSMFRNCESLKEINVLHFNTSNVRIMDMMFENCNSLKSLNLSSFNTSSVNDMSYMFEGCSSLMSVDISSFNPPSYCDITMMFFNDFILQEIKVSDKINLRKTNLSAPYHENIPGADGKWYALSNRRGYSPQFLPTNVADTYYGSPDLLPE